MIKFFILITLLLIPLSLIYFNFNYHQVEYARIFSVMILLVMIERIWETFFSFKDEMALKYKGDWTLILTLFTYLISGIGIVYEFFFLNRDINYYVSLIGLVFFLCSGFIRFWAIKLLKEQWSIHAIGNAKDRNVKLKLIKTGPYSIVRHPIYTATIFELFGLALMFNTFYTIIFIVLGINFYIIRAKNEEESLVDIFGEEYLGYRKDVPFIFPIKF